jgi:SAM-dependent methyltransferase
MDNLFAQATAPIETKADQDCEAYYVYMRDKGLDLRVCSDWQRNYATMLDAVFGLKGRRVLDLGAAMGALTLPMQEMGADAWGVEINGYLVQETPLIQIRGRLLLGDIVEVASLFREAAFDLVHASQTLEHIAPDRQPDIFREMGRVLRRGGFLFAAMPMREPPRDGQADYEDPTHICIRPKSWWEEFRRFGFRDADPIYQAHFQAQAMYQEYRWDYLLWERV